MEAALSLLRPWEDAFRFRPRWHPRFLYILRLNQSSKERVSPNRLWVSAKEAEAAAGGAAYPPAVHQWQNEDLLQSGQHQKSMQVGSVAL